MILPTTLEMQTIIIIKNLYYFDRFPEPFFGGPFPLCRNVLNFKCLRSCNSDVYSGTTEHSLCNCIKIMCEEKLESD